MQKQYAFWKQEERLIARPSAEAIDWLEREIEAGGKKEDVARQSLPYHQRQAIEVIDLCKSKLSNYLSDVDSIKVNLALDINHWVNMSDCWRKAHWRHGSLEAAGMNWPIGSFERPTAGTMFLILRNVIAPISAELALTYDPSREPTPESQN